MMRPGQPNETPASDPRTATTASAASSAYETTTSTAIATGTMNAHSATMFLRFTRFIHYRFTLDCALQIVFLLALD